MYSPQQVESIHSDLKGELSTDHHQFKLLRDAYHGNYDTADPSYNAFASSLRDLRRQITGEKDPEIKFVTNYLDSVVNKYQNLLSGLPQLRVPTAQGKFQGVRNRLDHASYVEDSLYVAWELSSMTYKMADLGWYLPCMGNAAMGVVPDFDCGYSKFMVRSPEYSFPVPRADDSRELMMMCFAWEEYQSKIMRIYEHFEPMVDKKGHPLPTCTYIELWTEDSKYIVANGQMLAYVKHDMGYVPWVMSKFRPVPDEPFGESVIAQRVPLNQNMNMLSSLEVEALLEAIYPKIVLIDPVKAPEELDMSRGAVWGVNQGGDVKVLSTAGGIADVSRAYGRSEQAIKDGTEMSDAMFGQSQGSIVTGKAVSQQQAPTRSALEQVQTCLGVDLVRCNQWWLDQMEQFFPDGTQAYAKKFKGMSDTKGQRFFMEVDPKKFKGYRENDVIFQPAMNAAEKTVMNLQLLGGGIISKRYAMDQIGIPDYDSMQQEIMAEKVIDVVYQAMVAQAQQGQIPAQFLPDSPNPATAGSGNAALTRGSVVVGPPQGLPPGGPPPGAGGPAGALPPGPPNLTPLEGGAGAPTMGATPPGGEQGPATVDQLSQELQDVVSDDKITFDEAVSLFPQAMKIKGRVFLVGDVLPKPYGKGETKQVDVILTDGLDKKTILDQFNTLYGMIQFTVIKVKEPGETYFEVTPGHVSNKVVEVSDKENPAEEQTPVEGTEVPEGEPSDQGTPTPEELATAEGTPPPGGTENAASPVP